MSQKKQEALSSWFQDLAGNKSLQALSRSKVSLTNHVCVCGWVCMHVCFCPCGCTCVCVCWCICFCVLLSCSTPPSFHTDPTSDKEGRDI